MVTQKELNVWKQHAALEKLKQAPKFNSTSLLELEAKIKEWKQSFRNLYLPLGFNFNYPNFETENQLPRLIPFLGLPIDMSTKMWENFHLSKLYW